MSLEHILLGLLQEPATGYTLKATFDSTVRHFWAAELSQIYVTLQRMEKKGWLRSKIEPSSRGPKRRVYSLTAAGRNRLKAWLAGGPEFGDERYTSLAQVFFMAGLGDFRQTISFIKAVRRIRAQQLEKFRRIEREQFAHAGRSFDDLSDEAFHQYLTLRSGLHVMAARVKWCDETIKRIENRMKKHPRDRGADKRRT